MFDFLEVGVNILVLFKKLSSFDATNLVKTNAYDLES